jgi:hypothetical protein
LAIALGATRNNESTDSPESLGQFNWPRGYLRESYKGTLG